MEESKFFKFVWRFNSLILMVAGVLAIGVLSFAGYKIIKDVTRERSTLNIVNFQEENTEKENWQFGHLSIIQGSPYVMIPLKSDQSYAQSYYTIASHPHLHETISSSAASIMKHTGCLKLIHI